VKGGGSYLIGKTEYQTFSGMGKTGIAEKRQSTISVNPRNRIAKRGFARVLRRGSKDKSISGQTGWKRRHRSRTTKKGSRGGVRTRCINIWGQNRPRIMVGLLQKGALFRGSKE